MSKRNPQRTVTITILVATLVICGLTSCGKTQTAESLISEAQQYQTKGDHKAAIIQLKNALQNSPDNAQARYLLGTIYNQTGDGASAEKELRRALKLGSSPADVLPELAKSLLAQGQFQQALDDTKQLAGELESAPLSTLRGNAFLGLNKTQEARISFEEALKSNPGYPPALLGLSRYALTENNVASATDFSDQAVQQNPKNIDAWLFKGDLLRAQGKSEAALAAYSQVLNIQPDNISAYLNIALLKIAEDKFIEAQKSISTARKLSPNNLLVFYSQALLDFRQNKSAAALDSLQKILRVAPEHMPSVLLAGAVQLSLGSMPQAEQHLRKYLENDPNNLYAQKLLASTLMKSAQTPEAITLLTEAQRHAKEDVQLLSMLGEAYMQTGDFAKATDAFTQASALSPKTAELHTALGLSKLAQGNNERAISEMELGVKLNAKSPQVGVLLAMTQLRLKQYDKALAAAQAIEKAQPDNPLAQNLKGAAYLGKLDLSSARASFEKALSLEHGNFAAAVSLAQLDLQAKKPEVAKKRFESILEKDKKNVQIMTALANLALSQGQVKESTNWLEKASKENPESLLPSLQLIAHYLRIGEKQQALALAKKLQGSNSSNPEFMNLLAQAQFANDDKSAALETYSKLAAASPESVPVQLRIAGIQMAMKDVTAAAESLKKALSIQPGNLEAQLSLASLEASRGDFEQALLIAKQIQKKDPKSAVGYELEGNLLLQQKKPDLAALAFERAIAISPNGTLLVKLHASLSQMGNTQSADSRLSRWIKDHPEDAAVRMYQAALNIDNKQNQAAIEQYQAILRLAPDYLPALNNMASLYQEGKNPLALQYAEKAYKVAPDNPAVQDTLGWILVEQGDTKRGIDLLRKASTTVPASAEIHYHLALGLIKAGDKVQARKELEQVLSTGKNFSKLEEARTLLKQL